MVNLISQTAFVFLAVILYSYLIYSVVKKNKIQNLWTWSGWAVINLSLMLNLLLQGGNWKPILGFLSGNIAVTTAIVYSIVKRKVPQPFGRPQLIIAIFAIIAYGFWFLSPNPLVGTWAITLALFTCGLFNTHRTWLNPHEAPPIMQYIGFLTLNLLALAFRKGNGQAQLVPIVFGSLTWVLGTIAVARKYWIPAPVLETVAPTTS